LQLGLLYALFFLPLLLLLREGLNIFRESLFSILRMTIQLGLVGLYLTYLFQLNNIWLNLLWLGVMLTVAVLTTVKRANLSGRYFFRPVLIGTSAGLIGTTAFFILLVVRPSPFYDARYLIPLSGMILGNCLKANVLTLERFCAGVRSEEKEFTTYLMLGASLSEAVKPYLIRAMRASLNPAIAGMATIGLVALPGMMTGQMLGGSVPLTAIKYQIAIMLAIFIGETLSSLLNLKLSIRAAFNPYSMLREDIFRR
jgi:putative ABC transport system permease protein